VDPYVDPAEIRNLLNTNLVDLQEVKEADCLVFLVAHHQFAELGVDELDRMVRRGEGNTPPVLIDVKNIFYQKKLEERGYSYWSL